MRLRTASIRRPDSSQNANHSGSVLFRFFAIVLQETGDVSNHREVIGEEREADLRVAQLPFQPSASCSAGCSPSAARSFSRSRSRSVTGPRRAVPSVV
jgi:hypothetical protein